MQDVFERIWKKAIVAYSKYYSTIFLEEMTTGMKRP
jgi:hypothetical protein